jgi:MYXO-CTERM domain-containing protein
MSIHRVPGSLFRLLLLVSSLFGSRQAAAQIEFFDDFERSNASDLGQWTMVEDPLGLEMSYTPLAAKVGARGVRFVDTKMGAGQGLNINLFKRITPVLATHNQFIRAWIRLTSLNNAGQLVLLKIQHQSYVAHEMYLLADRTLRFNTWEKDQSQQNVDTATRVNIPQPLGQWILFELGAVNMGTANATAWASIDGQEVMRIAVNWTNLYARDVVAGMHYGTYDIVGTVDFDAFAATANPPPTRLVTQIPSGSAQVGACVPVRFQLQAAYDNSAQPAFHSTITRVDLVGSATGAWFSDAQCSQPAASTPSILTGQRFTTRYLKPATPGALAIAAVDPDFLSASADLVVTPADPPVPDAGAVDAGLPDSGLPVDDGGLADSGLSPDDAGWIDSGLSTIDAGMADADAAVAPDGSVFQPRPGSRNFDVGCGCSAGAAELSLALLLMTGLLGKRRRWPWDT